MGCNHVAVDAVCEVVVGCNHVAVVDLGVMVMSSDLVAKWSLITFRVILYVKYVFGIKSASRCFSVDRTLTFKNSVNFRDQDVDDRRLKRIHNL